MIDAVFYSRVKGEWQGDICRVTLDDCDVEYLATSEYLLHKKIGLWRPWDLIGRSPKPMSQNSVDRFSIDFLKKKGALWISCVPTELVEGALSENYLDFELEHWSCDSLLEKRKIDFPWRDSSMLSILGHPLCVFESGVVRIASKPARKIFHVNVFDGRRESVYLLPVKR